MAKEEQTKMKEDNVDVSVERDEIQWTNFEGKFIKLPQEEARVMLLANPGQVQKEFGGEKTYFLEFDVLELDGDKFEEGEKTFSTSSNRLAQRLKPIVKKIKADGSQKVSIMKVGDKFDTNYVVKYVD